MKPKIKWWKWFTWLGLALGFAFYTGWRPICWLPLGITLLTGLFRAYVAWVVPAWGRKLARLSPEEREQYMVGMSPEKRRKLEEKLIDYVA